jgi:3',5'-cyclic AMP phosphodiesterase CpdA
LTRGAGPGFFASMALLLHLSDLHIDAAKSGQRALFDVLIQTLRLEKDASHAEQTALFITGDVFDSGADRPDQAVPLFLDLHARIVAALGPGVPTVVLPGNHDRRWRGLVGPHRTAIFDALRARVDPRSVYVAGCRAPLLAEVIPRDFHRLPADVVAYDSTYLPSGWVSAGGLIRQEDLLHAHAQLEPDSGGRPLVLLVHHHLIPTPVTDVSFIDSRKSMPRLAKWLLGTALPAIVSNADREELTMTALGAGTALSTLHTFGRAVLLLHGHKHFPTARLVRGLLDDSGDVLIASAGSGGKRERLYGTHDPEAARLWPSFNALRLEGARLEIEAVSFSPKRANRPAVRRDLAKVVRHDKRWEPDAASPHVRDATMRVERDEARFEISPSRTAAGKYWDYVCERRVELFPHSKLRRYVDFVQPSVPAPRVRPRPARRRIDLTINGVTRYTVANGLRRTASATRHARGASTAFEWIGLLSRYGGKAVTLSLAGAHAQDLAPFGSVTDLATGRERPAPVEAGATEWRVSVVDCPPRTLLRIYWPLARSHVT